MAMTWRHAALSWFDSLTPQHTLQGWAGADPGDEAPLRAELFTADQMEQHGSQLAALHESALMRAPDQLLPRLADNERTLLGICASLAQSGGPQRRMTPAGEWLLDNLYLIEEETRIARRHLPPGYSRELPRLRTGPSAGLPRAYDLAIECVAHGEGRLARGLLTRFIASYQTVTPLLLGELWAIPIMLRLALIENLRRIAVRVARSRNDRELAAGWAERMVEVAEKEPKGLILVVADMARSDPPMTAPFVAELARRLHGRSAALALPLSWVEQRLAESQQTMEQLVQLEAQHQATEQVSVSNSIGSLRLLGATDWAEFVETLSTVEQALRQDPADVYARMDFATRDAYRHAVERIARAGAATEAEVAHAAVALARQGTTGLPCQAHVGYYLVDAGRRHLEQAIGVQAGMWERVARQPLAWYAGAVSGTSVLLPALVWWWASAAATLPATSVSPGAWLIVAGLVVLIASSQLAVTLVNGLAMLLVRPGALPRMDFAAGIPQSSRTLVVVPTMLETEQGIDELAQALEVRFLANRDPQLRFGLLTDFNDALSERHDGDEPLLRCVRSRIEALNLKYGTSATHADGGDCFFLFHRPRLWNPGEGAWMGYERKRGKLAALNALLRDGVADHFSLLVGDTARLLGVRYVITLDTDTQLPRDSAWKFVGSMAHPLNRPRFGGAPGARRVTGGYGILQPRVGISVATANRTRYGRLYGGDAGIDPYTRAVSDVYQDLFGEGSFIGKGIYDVDAFEQVLAGRLPENLVLSHDLLEGCYARSGLLSDVELVEESPARYDADIKRRHRWMRGDWQIAGWLMPRLRRPASTAAGGPASARGGWAPNPLSSLARWKILDNLRRSLAAPALLLTLVLGWTVLQPVGLWTLAALAVMALPPLLGLLTDLVRKPADSSLPQHLASLAAPALRSLGQALLALACLPYEAYVNLDAIARTVWRLRMSKRRLLEWQPSSQAGRRGGGSATADFVETVHRMGVAPAFALAVAAGLAAWRPDALPAAFAVLALWFLSPGMVWWLNQPLERRESALDAAQVASLRGLARRTWAFFDTFVTAQDNFLPPDNLQEQPSPRLAHRTSPTNIGLSLLANLAAHDFGHVTTGQLVERTAATLDTMERLERYHGHFLNWYDTQSLQPLPPRYVSSVDSGNLAGHLLTLRAGLLLLADEPPQVGLLYAGLADTLALLRGAAGGEGGTPLLRFAALLERHARQLQPRAPAADSAAFDALHRAAVKIRTRLDDSGSGATEDARRWAGALASQCAAALAELGQLAPAAPGTASATWDAAALWARGSALRVLARRAGALAEMDQSFLYDPARHLMAIGYNVDERRRDAGHYDLLASEVRLATFVAIAQARLPQQSWFTLGRQAAPMGGRPVLLSWSGSMFEYLMPLLVMPGYEHTLLDQTVRGAVERQIHYGKQRGVPWGISESAYNLTDAQLNYQYRAFGVPGLGLKRGLAEDLVVAPYATVMALMVDPAAAAQNLRRLASEGLAGTFGYFEAVDYTPSRLPRGETRAIVHSYMAHHQGMSLLALAYALLERPMQRRFESDPQLRATLLLLQERVPKAVAFQHTAADEAGDRAGALDAGTPLRLITSADTPSAEVQLLSNGRYHVMLTGAGGGYSRWKELALTRWQEDGTADAWGSFCYLRDLDSGVFWSNTHQPTRARAERYEAIFTEGRAEFRRRDQGIEAYTEIVVSPEDDIELRRLRLTNLGRVRRRIEVTTYAEVVLATAAADAQHPAFSKLFVQTETVADPAAILCMRRPRDAQEPAPWSFHLMAVHGAAAGPASHETDRARFIGRGRSLDAPAALLDGAALSGTAGAVLDPVMATRRVITLEAEQTATIDMVHGAAGDRAACLALVHKYADRRLADRVFEVAWTHSQVTLRQLNASEVDAQLYARLANSVVYAQPTLRASAAVLLRNQRAQSGLWGYAISGDLPIVLLQVSEASGIELVRQMVQAHAWWRLKGLAVDLVIWNEECDVYRQRLQEQILGLIAGSVESHEVDRPGGIFVRHPDQIATEDRVLLQSVARAVLSDRLGLLAEQVGRKRVPAGRVAALVPTRAAWPTPALAPARPPLLLDNGLGGFSPDGREYVIAAPPGQRPPAPWVNVIANPRFGTVVSEAGSSYTWCENAHELRLTPWHNDPVTDEGGEVIYLRDEDSGQVWHPAAPPLADESGPNSAAPRHVTRHGFGYSVFEHDEAGIHSELTVFVATDAAVKFSRLVLRNDGAQARRLSVTAYVEWVLGDQRARTAPHIHTEVSSDSGALHARNRYSNHFGDWVGFLDADESDRQAGTVTCDRTEFIGRNGSLRQPAALRSAHLSGRAGVALDPCAAIQVPLRLEPGRAREITFRLGMGRSTDEAVQLVRRFRGSAAVHQALDEVRAWWTQMLGAVQVRTPAPSLNLLANGWLVYQTLGCRILARSGYYQSGGAIGFRDQLQDAMALVHARPQILRAQLLTCASRQFTEGDVQHWWHPPMGHGVRTHISDDLLWLPLALCRYVQATGDTDVLDESVPFLEGRPLAAEDESYYDVPARSNQSASLYEHAARALARSLRFGPHGLPLMGGGDWNDGMNRVGHLGQGESVWLGFFLCEVLRAFAPLARRHGDAALAQRCDEERRRLGERLEASAWDGQWYRRAWFDDGAVLGSQASPACRIDSIAQSWAVFAGTGSPGRARQAMEAVAAQLVRPAAGLVSLLDPPFDGQGPNPGYIAGYVPGVRENGGQYTHAAVWAAMAFAALGDAQRAWQVTDLILPTHHGRTAEEVAVYKVEPYVVAADVYSVAPHTGRGGWSWYTGSAGWMYRLLIESLLGLRLQVDEGGASLAIEPCLPASWTGYGVDYRWRGTAYHIEIGLHGDGAGATFIELDGQPQPGQVLALFDDGLTHQVQVRAARCRRATFVEGAIDATG